MTYTVIALEFDLSTAKALIPLADARRFHDEEDHPAGAWVSRALIREADGREMMVYAKSWQSPDGKLSRVGLGAYGDTPVAIPPTVHLIRRWDFTDEHPVCGAPHHHGDRTVYRESVTCPECRIHPAMESALCQDTGKTAMVGEDW